MSTEAVHLTTSTGDVPSDTVTGVRPVGSLTQRASLNVVASLLDYAAKIAVTLVVIPILVAGLGRSLYGVWEMLGRLVGYMTAGDGRPTQALRLVIANLQASDDAQAKRRYVGAAFVVWTIFLPLIIAAGTLLVWFAPGITKAPPDLHGAVRLAAGLLIVGLVFANLASLPESVLRGMNLGYKRMGLQASLEVVGGALTAGAIVAGLGLAGAAASQILFGALMGVAFWIVVKKYVPWFGVARPTRADVRSLLSLSAWYSAGEAITKLLLASDAIILGILVSPVAVTSYVLTGYAARMAVNIHVLAAGGAIPGVGAVIGQRQYDKAAAVRHELLAVTWLFATTIGGTILLWNPSFLALWVGRQNYAGGVVNLLIVFSMAQTAFIRSDAYVIDATLQPRLRVIVAGGTAVLTVALAALLTWGFGMVGLCVGLLAGRLGQSIAYPALAHRCLGRPSTPGFADVVRPLAVMTLLFLACAWVGQRLVVQHWLPWTAGVAVTPPLVLGAAATMGLPADLRRVIVGRVREARRSLGNLGR
jgi:O-antigen/teichoic acid export membrane protein